jgi:hypothetical protein
MLLGIFLSDATFGISKHIYNASAAVAPHST